MAKRILERGEIEQLPAHSIPRIILPDTQMFARRAERLEQQAESHPLGDYLRLMARVARAQQQALDRGVPVAMPTEQELAQAKEYGMPPLSRDKGPLSDQWQAIFQCIVDAMDAVEVPEALAREAERLRNASADWLENQARAVLDQPTEAPLDRAGAPFIMAALQVVRAAAARHFTAREVTPLEVHRVCPVCGSLPVASIVQAVQPYDGYRYAHCSLCETEWHNVRAQCTQCGNNQDIGFYTADDQASADAEQGNATAPVRAEVCDECLSYRKIVYVEYDADVEPLADDLASMALDLLLSDEGYHRASGNPLLWPADEEDTEQAGV